MELTNHAAFVLALIVFALLLFATERIRLQATALLTLVVLVLGFALWPYQQANGTPLDPASLLATFGNEALITVCALMVLGKGVETTHALQPLVSGITRSWADRPRLTMLGILIGAAVFSAFLNNTPIVVVMLPVLIAIAKKNRTSPSKLLMPLGLVTIIGGMSTTIGTSTNLLVVDLAANVADYHIGIFDLLPYIAVAGSLGILYLWLIAPALTPLREPESSSANEQRGYIATLVVDENSSLVSMTVADLLSATHHSITIDRIQHNQDTFRLPLPTVKLHVGDHIYVQGTPAALQEVELELGVSLRTLDTGEADDPELQPVLQEILVTERSELDDVSLRRSKLVEDYGVVAIALHRPSQLKARSKLPLNRIRLQPGDILLCEGTKDQFEALLTGTRLLALTESKERHFNQRSTTALSIIAGVILLAALDIVPIVVSALLGVGLMRATKCLAWRHIGQALSTQVILVIVVSLALGQALMATGGDAYIASKLARVFDGLGLAYTVPGLMLMTAVLTNVVSNNAAAVIATPIGIQLAEQLGVPVTPLILAVLFGANLSFATPIGYQTNLLVFSAGGYKFADFLRVGLPLTLIMWVALSVTLVMSFS
ncbi:MAG: SLC13 family permease [Pseudomonadales bacterium]